MLCMVPGDFDSERMARDLVERSLAACVQIGPGGTSVYRWQDAVEKSDEKLLVIKSRSEVFRDLEAAIMAVHPYDVPEIIALPVAAGHEPYLAWLTASTAASIPTSRKRDSPAE